MDGQRLGMRAILLKSHHHSTVTDLLALEPYVPAGVETRTFGGIALNAPVGGINPFAVEVALQLGGKAIWFPTISSSKHLASHSEHGGKFPDSAVPLTAAEVPVLDANGVLLPEAKEVLRLAHDHDVMVATGHLDAAAVTTLLAAAHSVGITKLLVNHPNFIVGADYAQARDYVRYGAAVEHSLCMYDDRVPNRSFEVDVLYDWIRAIGPEHTVLASDLGQVGNPTPADSYVYVGAQLLELGCSEAELRQMTCTNPARLLGLDA